MCVDLQQENQEVTWIHLEKVVTTRNNVQKVKGPKYFPMPLHATVKF